jgi:hypothetical protein
MFLRMRQKRLLIPTDERMNDRAKNGQSVALFLRGTRSAMEVSMKRFAVFIAAGLLLALVSCHNGGKATTQAQAGSKPAPQETQQTILITMVSNPDELYNVVQRTYKPDVIKAALDTTATISSTDHDAVAFAIGSHAANALLAAVLQDTNDSKAIAGGVKDAASKLNISSDKIQALATQINTDLAKTDDKAREVAVTQDINALSAEFVTTLKGMGGNYESLLIQLGGWTEGVRIASKVVQTKFDGTVAAKLLGRQAEADWFMGQALGFVKSNPDAAQVAAALKPLGAAMTPSADRKLSAAQVAAIQKAAVAVQALFAK